MIIILVLQFVFFMFRVRKNGPGVHVVVSVTLAMKLSASVYLRVEQNSSFGGQGSQAWSIDNFAVLGQGPQEIDENFDNLTACHLLSQSSDDVKVTNQSISLFGRLAHAFCISPIVHRPAMPWSSLDRRRHRSVIM